MFAHVIATINTESNLWVKSQLILKFPNVFPLENSILGFKSSQIYVTNKFFLYRKIWANLRF